MIDLAIHAPDLATFTDWAKAQRLTGPEGERKWVEVITEATEDAPAVTERHQSDFQWVRYGSGTIYSTAPTVDAEGTVTRKPTLGIASALCFAACAAILTACTTTPQGKSLDRANYADLASTAAALTLNDNAVEANPLGYALIPIKLGMGWALEQRIEDCAERAYIVGKANSVFYGLSGNNIAVAAGLGFPYAPIIGLATGIWYYWLGYHLEPGDVWGCE